MLFLACLCGAAAPVSVTQVAPGLYVRHGEMGEATRQNADGIANIGFIVGDKSVAVIDPGGSLLDGERLRATIRRTTRLPIGYVILTHDHPDHIFGAGAFLADHPVFIGHANLPGEIAARGEYYRKRLADVLGDADTGSPVMPTRLVADHAEIDLGDRVLTITAWPAAHTDTDLTVLDTNTHTLWAADLLFVDRIPALDGSLTGWLKVLGELTAMPAVRAVPGHGPVSVPWPAGAASEQRYLTVLLHDVRAAIAHGRDINQAVAVAAASEHGRWALFDDYNGRNVTVAYKELEWE